MRKQLLLILLISLLVIGLASAEAKDNEKKIHDKWHIYHDFFTINDNYYEVTNAHDYGGEDMKVQTLVKRNQESYIISGKGYFNDTISAYMIAEPVCKSSATLRFCVEAVSIDPDQGARSDEGGTYRYGTKIVIYEEIPETAVLTYTQSRNDDTLYVNGETKVTATIANTGTKAAENIYYSEIVEEGLAITRNSGYDRKIGNQKVEKNIIRLAAGESESFTYYIQANEYANKSTINTNITYNNPLETKSLTKKNTISIPWPYKTTLGVGPKTIKTTKDQATLTYTITNQENVPIEASVTIPLPKNLDITQTSGFTQQGNTLVYSETIEPATVQTITATLQSRFTGTYTFNATTNIESREENFKEHKTATLAVNTDTITPNLVLSKKKMRGGESITIGAYLYNEDDKVAFINIDGEVDAGFFNEKIEIAKLAPNQRENPIFKVYKVPEVNQQVTYNVYLNGTFMTLAGEQKTFSTKEELIVLPKNKSVVLTQVVDKNKLARGEEVTIVVSVENVADSGYKVVTTKEVYDENLEKVFGTTTMDTHLFGGEKRELYTYKLRVPYSYSKESFTITTSMDAQGEEVTTIAKTITVTDPIASNTQTAPTNEEDEETTTQEPAEEPTTQEDEETTTPTDDEETTTTKQPSQEPKDPIAEEEPREPALTRLIKGIADFFAGLFS